MGTIDTSWSSIRIALIIVMGITWMVWYKQEDIHTDTVMKNSMSNKLDDLVNKSLVKIWIYWGLVWLMFTPSIGALISTFFNRILSFIYKFRS